MNKEEIRTKWIRHTPLTDLDTCVDNAMQEYSDQNTKPLKDEIAKLKASKLEILNHIKSGFEVQSDYSTQCNGYKYLCREVEQLKASKSEANEAVESQEDILRELISLIQTSSSVGIIMQKFTITRNNK